MKRVHWIWGKKRSIVGNIFRSTHTLTVDRFPVSNCYCIFLFFFLFVWIGLKIDRGRTYHTTRVYAHKHIQTQSANRVECYLVHKYHVTFLVRDLTIHRVLDHHHHYRHEVSVFFYLWRKQPKPTKFNSLTHRHMLGHGCRWRAHKHLCTT